MAFVLFYILFYSIAVAAVIPYDIAAVVAAADADVPFIVAAAAICYTVGDRRGLPWLLLLLHRCRRCLGPILLYCFVIISIVRSVAVAVVAAAIIVPYTAVSIRFDSIRCILVSHGSFASL